VKIKSKTKIQQKLLKENEELRLRLAEAEETLIAIRKGEVDALVTSGPSGEQIFTLKGADYSYRILIETMNEGAALLDTEHAVSYCNRRLAEMLQFTLEQVMGKEIFDFVMKEDFPRFKSILETGKNGSRGEVVFKKKDGSALPVIVACNSLQLETEEVCIVCTDLTELKKANDKLNQLNAELEARVLERTTKLKESETKYRIVADITFDFEFWIDQHGKYRYASPSSKRITGYSSEDFIKDTGLHRKIIYSDDLAKFDRHMQEGRIKQKPSEIEYRIIHKDGSVRWIDHVCQPVYGDKGEYLGLRANNRDITQRKKIENELRQSEEKYRLLVETPNSVIMTADKKLNITYMNEFGLIFFGYTAEELIGQNMVGAIIPYKDDKGLNLAEMVKDIAKNPERYKADVQQNKRKNGELVWVSWTNRIIYDQNGKAAEVLAIGNDVSKLKETEEKLRESEERMQMALKTSHSFTFEWETATDQVLRSESCNVVLGLSGNEAVRGMKKNYLQGIHPQDRQRYTQILNDLSPSKNSYQTEYRVMRGDGTIVILEESARGFFDQNGKLHRLVGITTDITERKQAEEILKRDKETLAKLVQEQADNLVVAQIELERAKRLSDIGTLAAIVAHELRNPLAAISLAASNIRRKVADTSIQKHLQNIEKKVTESDQIINNLLFYSRLKPPHLENTNIYHIFNECIANAQKQSAKNILVKNDFSDLNGVLIQADPLQMQEMCQNIVNNAYDAVRNEGGVIEISSQVSDKFVKIIVKDNGEGIEKEDVAKVFDPFFTTKTKGTGLGLSVCQQIINMHGGKIDIHSETGKGTSVIIELLREKKHK